MKIIAVVFCLMLNAGCSDNDDLTEEPPGPVHNENISIGSGNPEIILRLEREYRLYSNNSRMGAEIYTCR